MASIPNDYDERLYFSGDNFFDDLEHALMHARNTIELECYIFAADVLGARIVQALKDAAARGVRVRVLVDAIGSSTWLSLYARDFAAAGISFKVFHLLPWQRLSSNLEARRASSRFFLFLKRLNQRNHRKVCIIDGQSAWLGGMNIWDVHLESVHGKDAWRDTAIGISGSACQTLVTEFDRVFHRRKKRKVVEAWLRGKREAIADSSIIRLNSNRRLRKRHYEEFIERIEHSREAIWITNAYFVPTNSLLDALSVAASRGIDVRILVPGKSDLFFMPWVMSACVFGLLEAGARVFEYAPSVLHAKSLLIDDWALVGSSNLNHRSLLHDLEADVILQRTQSVTELKKQFLADLEQSRELTVKDYWGRRFIWRALGRLALLFRNWM